MIEERVKERVMRWIHKPEQGFQDEVDKVKDLLQQQNQSSDLDRLESERISLQEKLASKKQAKENVRAMNRKGIMTLAEFEKDLREITESEDRLISDLRDIENQIKNLSIWEHPEMMVDMLAELQEIFSEIESDEDWKGALNQWLKEIKLSPPDQDGNRWLTFIGLIGGKIR
jgi:gamma-glutamyl-gamma-aminobutyrate hydrolase PuuD